MNVCVFCGSSEGNLPVFKENAHELGALLGTYGHTLVYGGGNIGLMGVVADAALSKGGQVIGIIPAFLFEREVAHKGISELVVVNSMHERKKKMAELAQVFVALPGGWGTLDELAEILTWKQLKVIDAPVGILNTANFFDSLLLAMKNMAEHGFLKQENLNQVIVEKNCTKILTRLGVKTI